MFKDKSKTVAPILLMIVFVLIIVAKHVLSNSVIMSENPYLSTVVIQLAVIALPSLLYCTFKGNGYSSGLRLRIPRFSSILLMVSCLILMIFGSAALEYLISMAAGARGGISAGEYYSVISSDGSIINGLYLVLAFALLPAVTEEFLFRGIIITEYEKYGLICAVLMSSVTFSMCHFNIYKFPIYFFCGTVLALLTLATRSVYSAMLVHTLYNVVTLFFEDYILHIAEKQNISGTLFLIIVSAVTLLFIAITCFEASSLYSKYAYENLPEEKKKGKKKNGNESGLTAFLSPTFIFLVVIFIVVIVTGL